MPWAGVTAAHAGVFAERRLAVFTIFLPISCNVGRKGRELLLRMGLRLAGESVASAPPVAAPAVATPAPVAAAGETPAETPAAAVPQRDG